jgi:hypothetical protein
VIGLIFIPLCKISEEVNDGSSIDMENHPTTLEYNMMYIQNTHHFPSFKMTFADWLKFSFIEELMNEIDV